MANSDVDVYGTGTVPVQTFKGTVGGVANVQTQAMTLVDQNGLPSVLQDIFGTQVVGERVPQIFSNFFATVPQNQITVTVAGSGTNTGPANGLGTFSTLTTASSECKGVSGSFLNYTPASELYAAFTALFSSPISTGVQRIGLYNSTDGFSFGYSGTSFGLWTRFNTTDTFVAQASWNVDPITGGAGSQFTLNGAVQTFNPADLNLFRIRFGWLGIANIIFEVLAPDGNFVIVHVVKLANSQTTASVTSPQLPMTVDVTNGATASTVSISAGCWVAGSTTSTGSDQAMVGNLAAANAAVTVSTTGLASVGMQLEAGTLQGTIVPEVSFDGGLTWNATYFDATTGLVSSFVFGSNNTATAATIVGVGGAGLARVRVSAYTSGTATCFIRGSMISDPAVLHNGVAGNAAPPFLDVIGGQDGGGVTRAISVVAKGTQAALGVGTQDLKDSGRSILVLTYTNTTSATTTTVTVLTTLVQNSNFSSSTGVTAFQVPAGKTLRLQTLAASVIANTTTTTATSDTTMYVDIRVSTTNTTTALSTAPIVFTLPVAVGFDTLGNASTATVNFPDGVEIPASDYVGIAVHNATTTVSLTLTGVSLVGYTY